MSNVTCYRNNVFFTFFYLNNKPRTNDNEPKTSSFTIKYYKILHEKT